MKKIFATLSMALVAVAMMAQQAVITFEETEHDFGRINEADGRVTTVFTFKNEGMEPLVLSNVRASCGCTTPNWTREPVEPGQTGTIKVTYNPNGRPGRFQKTITVTSNATEGTKRLYIKGEVIPKPAQPVNQYPVKMGALSLKSKSVDFGSFKKGESVTREIEYANLGDKEITIELATRDQDVHLLSQVTNPTIKPKETGKLVFIFDAKAFKSYGPEVLYAYVVVNGKEELSEEYMITLRADVVEDFSNLTPAQRQQAPIMEMESRYDLGKVAAGKVLRGNMSIKNSGVNALQIRRVYCSDSNIKFSTPKSVKASPKAANIKVEINTQHNGKAMEPGKYVRQVLIITNDPNRPRLTVNLSWTVE